MMTKVGFKNIVADFVYTFPLLISTLNSGGKFSLYSTPTQLCWCCQLFRVYTSMGM